MSALANNEAFEQVKTRAPMVPAGPALVRESTRDYYVLDYDSDMSVATVPECTACSNRADMRTQLDLFDRGPDASCACCLRIVKLDDTEDPPGVKIQGRREDLVCVSCATAIDAKNFNGLPVDAAPVQALYHSRAIDVHETSSSTTREALLAQMDAQNNPDCLECQEYGPEPCTGYQLCPECGGGEFNEHAVHCTAEANNAAEIAIAAHILETAHVVPAIGKMECDPDTRPAKRQRRHSV